MSTLCVGNCTNPGILHDTLIEDNWAPWNTALDFFEYQPWVFSLLGSFMVGLSGVLPLLIIPIEESANLKSGAGAGTLKLLLSFAVGGLLGDVFLHLLPEAWASKTLAPVNNDSSQPTMTCGLWVLSGFLVFIVAEKMFVGEGENDEKEEGKENNEISKSEDHLFRKASLKEFENNNFLISSDNDILSKLCTRNENSKNPLESPIVELKFNFNKSFNGYKGSLKNGVLVYPKEEFTSNIEKKNGLKTANDILNNGFYTNGFVPLSTKCANGFATKVDSVAEYKKNDTKTVNKTEKPKHISGYLNLMANCIDNFTHGLAVGGSFLISFRLGALTTFAILVHEIPHEVGDFAILLRSGFSRWDAAKAQLYTASGGIFGALVAVICSGNSVESKTSWILPFTAGGFLHIGLVSVLPELLKETNPKESLKQLGALLAGITIMAFLTVLCD